MTFFPILATLAWAVLHFEGSDRFFPALGLVAIGSLSVVTAFVLPGSRSTWAQIEGWRSGRVVSTMEALESTYVFARSSPWRAVLAFGGGTGLVSGGVSEIAGATAGSTLQHAANGAGAGVSVCLITVHLYTEAALRPIRRDMAGGSGIGDHLPRATPTFATWSTIALLAAIWVFSMAAALFGTAIDAAAQAPVAASVIATALLLFFGVPVTLTTAFAPSLQPIKELLDGTGRVGAGDFSRRLPVDQDDDLGVVAASFNRMQDGLVERQRLHAAFGSYVDPSLARRLLAQGDDLFSGERVEVTVMFADIRNFTPFAEANSAEDTVAHLNSLFELVVTVVNAHGGHVNKFLGDGAMIVFGAPERLDTHADRAVAAAVDIQREIRTRFDASTSLGIGINTGPVIAGTIGGAGKLEFTLIGDAVNVAARVEQLTKTTGDGILITEATATALRGLSSTLHHRGAHAVRGKTAPVIVHAIDPHEPAPA